MMAKIFLVNTKEKKKKKRKSSRKENLRKFRGNVSGSKVERLEGVPKTKYLLRSTKKRGAMSLEALQRIRSITLQRGKVR